LGREEGLGMKGECRRPPLGPTVAEEALDERELALGQGEDRIDVGRGEAALLEQ